MSATRLRRPVSDDTVPNLPQITPPGFATGLPSHDFTLQAVMELQKSVAEMNATLIATKAAVDGLKSKVDDLIAWKHKILGGAVVLGAVLAFIAFVAGKASEYVTLRPVATAQAPAATLPPQLSATAASK